MVAGFQDDLDSDDDYIPSQSRAAIADDVDLSSDDEKTKIISAKSVELSSDEDENRPAVKQNDEDISDSDEDMKPSVIVAQDFDLSSDDNDSGSVTQQTGKSTDQSSQSKSEKALSTVVCDDTQTKTGETDTVSGGKGVEDDSNDRSVLKKTEVSSREVEVPGSCSSDDDTEEGTSQSNQGATRVRADSEGSSVEGHTAAPVVILADEDVSEEELVVSNTEQAGLSDWLDQLETKVGHCSTVDS